MANNELDDVQQRVVNETLRRRGVRSSNQIPAPEGWHYDDQGRLMPIDPALARLAKTSLQSDAKQPPCGRPHSTPSRRKIAHGTSLLKIGSSPLPKATNAATMQATLPAGGTVLEPGSDEWHESADAVIDAIIAHREQR